VLQPGQDLDLQQEALGRLADDDLGAEDLDRHGAVVLAVAGEVDDCHAAPAEYAVYGVAVTQRGGVEGGLGGILLHTGKVSGAPALGMMW
jgi:hypothetical protein